MKRPVLISILILAAMCCAFILPKPKYESLDILSSLEIPTRMPGWVSVDVAKELNLKDERYNFIQNAFARVYRNQYGEELLLLILDAGNFHNPKVCYTSSGFLVKEMDDTTFEAGDKSVKSVSLDMENQKQDQGVFLFYWLCIDKKIKDWAGQKASELWASLFNKRKAGLMFRMEIPAQGRTSSQAVALGQEFVKSLSDRMPPDQRQYLFGE